MSQLAVIVDGRPLPAEQARALWGRFSAHMDAHQGDFDGFAASEGYGSARVSVAGSTPTLMLTSVGADPDAKAKGSRRPEGQGGSKRSGSKRSGGRKQRRAPAKQDDGSGGSSPPKRKRR